MSESLITKRAIAAALKQLCAKKAFSKISIADITESCGLNRQTFYYHFQDKYDLLNWIYYDEAFSRAVEDISFENWNLRLCGLLEEMQREKVFYVNTIKSDGSTFSEYLNQMTETLFYDAIDALDEHRKLEEEQKNFFARFFSYGICGIVISWAVGGMKERPQKVAFLLQSLVQNGEKAAFEKYLQVKEAEENP